MNKQIVFDPQALQHFAEMALQERKLFKRILALIKDIQRSSFEGIGKPEALKHQLTGYWSRRIDAEHRLVYKVTEDGTLFILSCKGHYKDLKT